MDSARDHEFGFDEAVPLFVVCDTQDEINCSWKKLSADPRSERGWLKDKLGVSRQVTRSALRELLASGDQAKIQRVTQAFLKRKKFDIAELQRGARAEGPSSSRPDLATSQFTA